MKRFETPEVEIENFQIEDVLTASGEEPTVKDWNPDNAGQWQTK